MSVKQALTFSFCAALLGCVPASEKLPSAGAAGFLTVPSAAARGEPVTTEDGWTVTFDTIVVQATVNVDPVKVNLSSFSYGSSSSWLWDGSKATEIYARQLPPGSWGVAAKLQGSYISRTREIYDEDIVKVGVSGEELARFRTFADVGFHGNPRDDGAPGPTVLVALRAEKSGRAVELDLTFAGLMVSGNDRGLRQVRADAVDLGPLGVESERLLANEVGGPLRFDPIANADTNGDGRVTASELAAAPAPRVSQGSVSGSLGDVLGGRCSNILVMRGPTTPAP